jgi:hypothetical protein
MRFLVVVWVRRECFFHHREHREQLGKKGKIKNEKRAIVPGARRGFVSRRRAAELGYRKRLGTMPRVLPMLEPKEEKKLLLLEALLRVFNNSEGMPRVRPRRLLSMP